MVVSKVFAFGDQKIKALLNVSLLVQEGEFMALAGPSGSGKSTLLNLIGCIDTPTSGVIRVDGTDTVGRNPDQLADFRAKKIGFIFQTFNLLPVLSAFENVEYPLLRFAIGKKERRELVARYLDLVGVGKYSKHRPNQLSGGQRQRVAIARALITRPRIILADEPTANLDHKTGERILNLMKKINQNNGTTFIFSTHDPKVLEIAGRVVNLIDGETA
jgi:putative ABC transport system ATP-binding protein